MRVLEILQRFLKHRSVKNKLLRKKVPKKTPPKNLSDDETESMYGLTAEEIKKYTESKDTVSDIEQQLLKKEEVVDILKSINNSSAATNEHCSAANDTNKTYFETDNHLKNNLRTTSIVFVISDLSSASSSEATDQKEPKTRASKRKSGRTASNPESVAPTDDDVEFVSYSTTGPISERNWRIRNNISTYFLTKPRENFFKSDE